MKASAGGMAERQTKKKTTATSPKAKSQAQAPKKKRRANSKAPWWETKPLSGYEVGDDEVNELLDQLEVPRPKRKVTASPHPRAGDGIKDTTAEQIFERMGRFIEALNDSYGCIADGLRGARISRSKYERWRKDYPRFAKIVDEIKEAYTDTLERSAMKRAIEGTKRPIYDKNGEYCGEEQTYETNLTIFMLKAKRRGEFGDNLAVRVTPEEFASEVQAALAAEDDRARSALGNAD